VPALEEILVKVTPGLKKRLYLAFLRNCFTLLFGVFRRSILMVAIKEIDFSSNSTLKQLKFI